MKIEYAENPLATKIILDEPDKEILKLNIKIKELEELTGMAEYYVAKGEVEKGLYYLDSEYICDGKLDERVDEVFKYLLEDCESIHTGDCTCFPGSCSKCYLESLLNVDTTPTLSKYMGYRVEKIFSTIKTCEEAIQSLKSKEQDKIGEATINWLMNYQEMHLKMKS